MEKTNSESEMNEGEILTLAESFKDLVKMKNGTLLKIGALKPKYRCKFHPVSLVLHNNT